MITCTSVLNTGERKPIKRFYLNTDKVDTALLLSKVVFKDQDANLRHPIPFRVFAQRISHDYILRSMTAANEGPPRFHDTYFVIEFSIHVYFFFHLLY